MKHIQKIGRLFLVFLLLAGIASCDKNKNIEAFEVFGDVMIIKRMDGDQSYFARSYFVYGNYPMSSAQVTLPEGTTLVLNSPDETLRTYLKEPAIADFGGEPPMTGQFEFTVVNEDIEHTTTDDLTFNNLPYATITRAEYSAGAIMVEWESVEGADNYLVRMVNDNYEEVFKGYLLAPNVNIYKIAANNGYMPISPENGETYTVEVNAFDYEEGATQQNSDYNVNEISVATTTVVWGE